MNRLKGYLVAKNKIELNISRQLRAAIVRIDRLSWIYANREIVITSGSEEASTHSAKSKHHAKNNASGLGEAVDIRTFHYSESTRGKIESEFYKIKGFRNNYDLIWECTRNEDGVIISQHWHLEYDPKN